MSTWNPKHTCHDCNGPRYRDTVRCAYHGLMHQWKQAGVELPKYEGRSPAMWNNPITGTSRGQKLPTVRLDRVA